MSQIQVRVFPGLYSPRLEDTKWHVTQSMTLLKLAEENDRSKSLVTYAAFEMRQAIEQEMFRIVRLVSKAQDEDALLERCRKKDGLFKELLSAEPNYTNHLLPNVSFDFRILCTPCSRELGHQEAKAILAETLWLLSQSSDPA